MKQDLPHGLTAEEIKDLENLDSNIQVGPDITAEEYFILVRYLLRRRRRAGAAGQISVIVTDPSVLSVAASAPLGTVVGTLSVIGGFATYSYTILPSPDNYFTIVGNEIRVAATLPSPRTLLIQIQGDNGLGDRPLLTTTITVLAGISGATYYIYGF